MSFSQTREIVDTKYCKKSKKPILQYLVMKILSCKTCKRATVYKQGTKQVPDMLVGPYSSAVRVSRSQRRFASLGTQVAQE